MKRRVRISIGISIYDRCRDCGYSEGYGCGYTLRVRVRARVKVMFSVRVRLG